MWSAHSGQRRTRHAAQGREELLASATKVIVERGLAHTRFTDVSEATGASVSTLQYYFGSREDLLIAVIGYASQEELHLLRALAVEATSPAERLTRLIAGALGENESLNMFWRLQLEVSRAAAHDAELRSLSLQRYEGWLAVLRDILQEGLEQDLLPPTAGKYDVPVLILALIDGLATPLLIEYPAVDSNKARQLAAEIVATVLRINHSLPGIAS